MMVVIYRDDGEVIDIFPRARVEGGDVISGGSRVASGLNANWAYVPDQDISHLYKMSPEGELTLSARFPDDFVLFSEEEKKQAVDIETEEKINSGIHPFAFLGEQIGILRDQLVRVLNALGIEPTEDFARLNEIAIREIKAAREKKEAIDAQDDSA